MSKPNDRNVDRNENVPDLSSPEFKDKTDPLGHVYAEIAAAPPGSQKITNADFAQYGITVSDAHEDPMGNYEDGLSHSSFGKHRKYQFLAGGPQVILFSDGSSFVQPPAGGHRSKPDAKDVVTITDSQGRVIARETSRHDIVVYADDAKFRVRIPAAFDKDLPPIVTLEGKIPARPKTAEPDQLVMGPPSELKPKAGKPAEGSEEFFASIGLGPSEKPSLNPDEAGRNLVKNQKVVDVSKYGGNGDGSGEVNTYPNGIESVREHTAFITNREPLVRDGEVILRYPKGSVISGSFDVHGPQGSDKVTRDGKEYIYSDKSHKQLLAMKSGGDLTVYTKDGTYRESMEDSLTGSEHTGITFTSSQTEQVLANGQAKLSETMLALREGRGQPLSELATISGEPAADIVATKPDTPNGSPAAGKEADTKALAQGDALELHPAVFRQPTNRQATDAHLAKAAAPEHQDHGDLLHDSLHTSSRKHHVLTTATEQINALNDLIRHAIAVSPEFKQLYPEAHYEPKALSSQERARAVLALAESGKRDYIDPNNIRFSIHMSELDDRTIFSLRYTEPNGESHPVIRGQVKNGQIEPQVDANGNQLPFIGDWAKVNLKSSPLVYEDVAQPQYSSAQKPIENCDSTTQSCTDSQTSTGPL